ncbi:hypothetical protein [Clostridium felsineum]|uniref:hypothetical protein n=1 Tax=Clostridium felsineum TaxID=36839 RepID=UPI003969E7DA
MIGQTTATVLSVVVDPDDVGAAVSKASKAESLLGKMGTFSKSIAVSSVENAKNITTLPWRTIDNLGSKVADLRTVLSEGKGAIGDFRKSVVVSSAKNAKSLLTKVKSTVSDVKTVSASFAKAFGKTYAKECRKYVNTCFSASGAAGAGLEATYKVTKEGIKEAKNALRTVKAGESGSVDGTGNLSDLVKNYTDDIPVNGKVDATKMNDLKLAIQNNKFSADEIKQISAYMDSLGITEEYYSVMKTIDIGKHLKNIKGAPPADMINAHAHHILFKNGLGKTQKKLVLEGQKILRKYGIDPIIGGENLVWAPNGVIGQHNLEAIQNVVNQLKAVEDAGGDYDDIVEVLEELGELASQI